MPIFQKSIVDKYLETLDAGVLDKAYDSYKEVYSAQKIQRIKKLKEEQYQGGFLKDIFGSVLGYTIDPEVGYNIELEKKNETNSKKADGAILQDEKVLGVIELKSNTTKNLESIKDQAFGYKNNHKGCKYVISSNFHKLRFYVDDATEYEEFDLYNLDKETFKKFYLYLRKEGLLDKNIPKLLKEETKFHEENISKQLYKDYSSFKNKYFENIVKNNPQYDKLLLFKKSQKFLDRILFVLFAEDKELIPTNAISRIVESWALADDLHYKPLYELFTILFEHLNVGHTYKSGYEIPAYNGGLFAPDEVLDNLKVDDEILKDDLLTLSKYDFNTDVDVNILGHIFEHSLSEIEEIEAELKGEVADKSKGKRKKDGVFYTPKYITKYIVDNTVGKLCSEKKEVLGLDIDFDVQDYQKSNGSVNAKGKELFHTLESYKEWLLSLKILDPACGSGAFLNQALSFLIEEHKNIDDFIAELTNAPLRIFDTDKTILESNIYGVDINDESVEIAKLSLWLRTAQKGRKLSNLNNNIKCGNSLIDDPSVAGDKAFNWVDEFSEIFKNGGFDVVIGNPPYVIVFDPLIKSELEEKYSVFQRNNDLYTAFYQKSVEILKDDGVLGFITPNSFVKGDYFKKLREYFVNFQINSIVDFTNHLVFEDANVFSAIMVLSKNKGIKDWLLYSDLEKVKGVIENRSINFIPENNIQKKFNKIDSFEKYFLIKDVGFNYWSVGRGKVRGDSVGSRILYNGVILNEKDTPYIKGSNFNRYTGISIENYLRHNYDDYLNENDIFRYSATILEVTPKLIYRQTSSKLIGTIDSEKYYCDKTVHVIINREGENFDLKYVLGIFNSKLMNYIYSLLTEETGRAFAQVKTVNIKKLPFKVGTLERQSSIVGLVDFALRSGVIFSEATTKFERYFTTKFLFEKVQKKLKNWYELEFGDFIKELNKAIKKVGGTPLSKMDEMEWMDVFETKKEEAQALKSEIDKTDKEIDQMVYELYGLTEEEIQIVENN